ncbi:hypothetical protein EJ07DRAFT_151413 [Lizonia empirigonia]|nr:hypothetical protein EJ07DRAFT_151413 [Lizonia empirigonia]
MHSPAQEHLQPQLPPPPQLRRAVPAQGHQPACPRHRVLGHAFQVLEVFAGGSSSGGFLCALEDLWKKLLEKVPSSAQDMEIGTWTGEEDAAVIQKTVLAQASLQKDVA